MSEQATILSSSPTDSAPEVEVPTQPATATAEVAAESTSAQPQVSWKDSLPDELKTDPSLLKFNSVDALAKSYKHLEKTIGGNKLVIPDKHATNEDWAEVFKQLGNPEKLEDYSITVPESEFVDKDFVESFKERAHGLGILPMQAQELLNWYNESNSKAAEQVQEQSQAQLNETMNSLKQEWGVGMNEKLTRAQMAVKELGGDDLAGFLNESGLGNNPQLIRAFAKVGDLLSEDKSVQGGRPAPVTSGDLVARAKEMIGDANHAYNNPAHPNHRAAREEVKKLYEQAYADND
jgi:hypothetical protein